MNLKTITLLEKNGICVATFTNNKAALNKLQREFPKGLEVKIPSLATVNRKVVRSGDVTEVFTPLGTYTIRKTLLLKKGV